LKNKFSVSGRLQCVRQDIAKGIPEKLEGNEFDSIVCVNVLEHIKDDAQAIKNIKPLMKDGSKCIVLVPAQRKWFSPIDKILGHCRRYDKGDLRALIEENGLILEKIEYLNALPAFGWWLDFCLLRRKTFSRFQLGLVNRIVPLVRLADKIFPNFGLNLLAVCKRPIIKSF
jgi:SAM-dependent methyltransferase